MRKNTGKQTGFPGSQIGTSFLLVVFVILCLVVFAALSLSGALRDYEYSKKAAEQTTAYYAADSKAQRILGAVDLALEEGLLSEEDLTEAADTPVKITTDDEGRTMLSYEVPVSDSQALQIELELTVPGETGGRYRIIKWKEVSTTTWEEKTTLPVLGSDKGE